VPHLPLSDPLRWLVLLIAAGTLAVTLWPSPGKTSAYSVALTHRVDTKVQSANACRPWIGANRFAVRRTYARQSSAFRRWALRLWDGRADRCGREKARVGVPPWFRSVMLCIHPKESSDWYLNGHHEGGLQYVHSTWVAAGGLRFAAHAYEASPNEQIRAAFDLTDGSSRGLRWHWAATIGGCL
jgi:hypothetical protein